MSAGSESWSKVKDSASVSRSKLKDGAGVSRSKVNDGGGHTSLADSVTTTETSLVTLDNQSCSLDDTSSPRSSYHNTDSGNLYTPYTHAHPQGPRSTDKTVAVGGLRTVSERGGRVGKGKTCPSTDVGGYNREGVDREEVDSMMGSDVSSSVDGDGEEEGEKEEEECGLGGLSCCQKLRNIKLVLFCFCSMVIIQGMLVNGFVSVNISTIERRFSLSSTDAGVFASGYEIASVLWIIPMSYLGGRGHKPHWIACGMFIMSIGSFLFSIPHFIIDSYRFETDRRDNLCSIPANDTDVSLCSLITKGDDTGSLSSYMWIFFVAHFLNGIGCVPIYTLAVAYIDENLPSHQVPVYLAIYYTMAIIGPALGYIIGGQLLRIYVDVGQGIDISKIDLRPDSSQWLGAWWIGFLIAGCLAFIIAIPISSFPRSLPGSAKLRAQKASEVYKGGAEKNDDDNLNASAAVGVAGAPIRLKKICATLRLLFTNITFMALNGSGSCEGFVCSGLIVFAPKFVEYQFSITAGWAAQLIGLVAIPSGACGTLLGGYFVKRFKLKCRGVLRLSITTASIALLFTLALLIRCKNGRFVGINVGYESNGTLRGEMDIMNLNGQCNNACSCQSYVYEPICGEDGLTYFSPCYAGCTNHTKNDKNINDPATTTFHQCSCIHPPSPYFASPPLPPVGDGSVKDTTRGASRSPSDGVSGGSAVDGKCPSDCLMLPVFLTIFATIICFTFMTGMPALTCTLRCVPVKERSLALGIQGIIFRLLGMIPAPIVFGAIIDATCLMWQQGSCDSSGAMPHGHDASSGACIMYDNLSMSTRLFAVIFGFKLASVLFLTLSYVSYKPPPVAEHTTRSHTMTEFINSAVPGAMPEKHDTVPGVVPERHSDLQTITDSTSAKELRDGSVELGDRGTSRLHGGDGVS